MNKKILTTMLFLVAGSCSYADCPVSSQVVHSAAETRVVKVEYPWEQDCDSQAALTAALKLAGKSMADVSVASAGGVGTPLVRGHAAARLDYSIRKKVCEGSRCVMLVKVSKSSHILPSTVGQLGQGDRISKLLNERARLLSSFGVASLDELSSKLMQSKVLQPDEAAILMKIYLAEFMLGKRRVDEVMRMLAKTSKVFRGLLYSKSDKSITLFFPNQGQLLEDDALFGVYVFLRSLLPVSNGMTRNLSSASSLPVQAALWEKCVYDMSSSQLKTAYFENERTNLRRILDGLNRRSHKIKIGFDGVARPPLMKQNHSRGLRYEKIMKRHFSFMVDTPRGKKTFYRFLYEDVYNRNLARLRQDMPESCRRYEQYGK